MTLAIIYLLAGLVLLYYGAEALVRGSSSLALRLGLSPLVVGLTVVAFGTSTPELMVSLKAALAGQADISVGNVVGSNICNIGLILGICALVTPIATTSQIVRIDIPIMLAITAITIFLLADGTIGLPEGIFLTTLLVAYIVFSIGLARRQPVDSLGTEFGEEVKAVVQLLVPASATPAVAEQLIQYCRSHLSHAKCQRSVDFMTTLPRHPTGKLYKRILRDPYWSGHESAII